MFIATNRLFVLEGEAAGFEQQFADNMRSFLPGVPGLRRSTLLCPTALGQPYVSVNEFDSREAFEAWVASASFKAAHDRNRTMARHITGNAIETFSVTEDLVLGDDAPAPSAV